MKILQVINAFYPPYSSGGAAFVAHNISKALAKRGHEVTVYTTNALSGNRLFNPKQNPSYSDGVKVYYFANTVYKPSMQIYFSKDLMEASKKNIVNYEIVHLHEYRSYISLVTSYYAKKHGVPYILQVHGQLPRIMAKRRLKRIYDVFFGYRLLRDASRVIALNQMEADQYRCMGVPEEKIEVIPNGIDLSEYADLPPKGSFKKKFNIDEDEKIVLYLGRIHRIKGIDILVKAFASIVEKLDDVKLLVVGPDDGYLGKLEALTNALKIEDDVLISGPLYGKDKLEAYVDADVYVLPSRYETFPMGLLEAYACGTPVVASIIGGLKDLVIDKVTGLLVEFGDIKWLANSIFYMLNEGDRAEELGLMGKKFVEENFTIDKVINILEQVYKEITK